MSSPARPAASLSAPMVWQAVVFAVVVALGVFLPPLGAAVALCVAVGAHVQGARGLRALYLALALCLAVLSVVAIVGVGVGAGAGEVTGEDAQPVLVGP